MGCGGQNMGCSDGVVWVRVGVRNGWDIKSGGQDRGVPGNG